MCVLLECFSKIVINLIIYVCTYVCVSFTVTMKIVGIPYMYVVLPVVFTCLHIYMIFRFIVTYIDLLIAKNVKEFLLTVFNRTLVIKLIEQRINK